MIRTCYTQSVLLQRLGLFQLQLSSLFYVIFHNCSSAKNSDLNDYSISQPLLY